MGTLGNDQIDTVLFSGQLLCLKKRFSSCSDNSKLIRSCCNPASAFWCFCQDLVFHHLNCTTVPGHKQKFVQWDMLAPCPCVYLKVILKE
jgi:hypothetical protein